MTTGLFLVWGIMNKPAINTHVKKQKNKWILSLVMSHTDVPSLSPKPKSQISALNLEEVPAWCPLTHWRKIRTRASPLTLNRLSTELALLPTPGCLWKGSSHAWVWLSHGKERDQRSDWTSFWGKKPETNRKEQQYPGTKFLTDDDSIKNWQL